MEQSYKTCEYGKFNEVWGEAKCTKLLRTVYDPEKYCKTCLNYKKKPKEKTE